MDLSKTQKEISATKNQQERDLKNHLEKESTEVCRLDVFNDKNFREFRKSEDIAREIGVLLLDFQKITPGAMIGKFKELSESLKLSAILNEDSTADAEANKAFGLYERLQIAAGSSEGIKRGDMVTLIFDSLPEGRLRRMVKEKMTTFKANRPKDWNDKLGTKASGKKEETKFRFKNWHEWKEAGAPVSEKPVYPKPKARPQSQWCKIDGWGNHQTADCYKLKPKQEPRQETRRDQDFRGVNPRRSRSRSRSPRKGKPARK